MPMPNKMPKFFDKHKICIICEGNALIRVSIVAVS